MNALRGLFPAETVAVDGIPCHRLHTDQHTIDFHPSPTPSEDIVVTFDRMSAAPQTLTRDRPGWGFASLARQGFNVLSVKPQANDWYRDPSLRSLFRSFQRRRVFAPFRRTVFVGASMGGFAALAFARTAPGATIIAMNPQSTLDPRKVDWERRFLDGARQDWSGDFADGAEAGTRAGTVAIFYDPHHAADRRHVERLKGGTIAHFRLPYAGGGIADILSKMGVMDGIVPGVLDGTLTPTTFPAMARRRKLLGNHWLNLAQGRRGFAVRRALLERGIAKDPRYPGCYVALANDFLQQGAPGEAERVIGEAHARFPYHVETLCTLSDVLAATGALDAAFDAARKAADRMPNDPRATLRLARISFDLGRLEDASGLAQAAAKAAERWPGVRIAANRLLTRIGADTVGEVAR